MLILDATILDLFDSPTPGAGMTTAPLVVEDKFRARAVLRGELVLEIDALDRGSRPRTELRLCAVTPRPSLHSRLRGGRSRQADTLVHSSVSQIAGRVECALSASRRAEPFRKRPVEEWVEELREGGQQPDP